MQKHALASLIVLGSLLSCGDLPTSPICGNNLVESGEACDDGNTTNGDGCNGICQLEQCGDGVLAASEECDDGNQIDTDTCTSLCQNAECGDSFIQTGVEECDDTNAIAGDGCNSACIVEFCGDGVDNNGNTEVCDDGNQIDDDVCSNNCQLTSCGDGALQAGEACDDGNQIDTDACTSLCQNPECGDGFVQANVEECDDGNQLNNDGCSQVCTFEGANPPSLIEIDPSNSLIGFETANVILTGDNFAANAAVSVAGVSVPVASCDYTGVPTQIECTIPASNTVSRGDVTVTNPDNQSASLTDAWTFTGVNTDVEFCNTQFPKDLINAPGTSPVAVNTQVFIFGQLFEAGLTDANNNAAPGVTADFGLSTLNPAGADIDPTASTTWRFRPVQPNPNFNFAQNNDEYFLGFVPNTIGNFRYVFRFSLDGGLNFTYCDKDDANNSFEANQTSQMEVIQ